MSSTLCVLQSSYAASQSPFAEFDPPATPAHFAADRAWHHAQIDKARAVAQIIALAQQPCAAFINLCDGAWDEDRAGIEVAQTLQRLGQAYTGASPEHYDPSREAMKRALHYAGLATPRYAFAATPAQCAYAAQHLRLPVIAKHPASYGSIALDRNAVCTTPDRLQARVAWLTAQFGQALLEEFIAGREFTVLVAEGLTCGEPRTWPPVEFTFPPGETFKHFALKWVDHAQLGAVLVGDAELAMRLRDTAAQFFTALGCDGYGRVDIRMADDGVLQVLEINPN